MAPGFNLFNIPFLLSMLGCSLFALTHVMYVALLGDLARYLGMNAGSPKDALLFTFTSWARVWAKQQKLDLNYTAPHHGHAGNGGEFTGLP